MKNSSIEWTDHTFNPWSGCTKVSPGCANCYAESLAKRAPKTLGGWGAGVPRRRTSEEYWRGPVKWNKEAAIHAEACIDAEGDTPAVTRVSRPRVFCASLADWLDDEVPVEWLADLLDLVRQTSHLDWLLLTKRPENWYGRITAALDWVEGPHGPDDFPRTELGAWINEWTRTDGVGAPANVWIGTTVEDQTRADERIPALLAIPARVRFLSCEPLLGPVDLFDVDGEISREMVRRDPRTISFPADLIDWVIVGGESGPKARPMHPEWARSLRDQCAEAGVPFFFKQWGEWVPWERGVEYAKGIESDFVMDNGTKYSPGNYTSPMLSVMRVGKKTAGRLLDGREWNEVPA